MTLNVLRKRKVKLTIHFVWMFIFILVGLIGSFFAYNSEVAFLDIINLSLKLFFYTALIAFINTEDKVFFVVKTFIFSGLILAIRILIFTPLGNLGLERIGSSLDLNANGVGTIFIYSSILSFFIGMKQKKYYFYIIGVFLLFLSLLSGSKAVFFLILVGLVTTILINIKTKMQAIIIIIIPIITLGLYKFIMNISFFYNILGHRIEGMISVYTGSNIIDASTNTRLTMIQEAWNLFKERSILGYGLENFRLLSVFDSYSHNNYLELLSSTGVLGTIVYYSLPVCLLSLSIKNRIKEENKNYNFIILLLIFVFTNDISSVTYKKITTQIIILLCMCYYSFLKERDNWSNYNIQDKLSENKLENGGYNETFSKETS